MSSDNNSNDTDDGVLSPVVSTKPRIHNLGMGGSGISRGDIGGMGNLRESQYMNQYGGERDLFNALGYIADPDYKHYRSRYERTDTAPALVDKLPQKAWAKPTVIDTGADDGESEFEKAVNEFLDGEYTEEDPINVLERAARMERLGNYSLIFLGLNDANADPSEHETDDGTDLLSNEVDADSLEEMKPEEAISYISPYDQARAPYNEIQWENGDPTSERFGKPESYNVDFGEDRPSGRVHWSRIVHVVGDVFDNEYRSPSILKQSLNRIDDIEKILGGSAEGYWRGAYQGLVVSPPEVNGKQTEFSDDGESLHKQINRYINNFSREIFTAADVDPIDVSAENPTPFLDSQYKDLSVGHDIPHSILMGNETGERATEEDRNMWHERVAEFRLEYCIPAELGPVIDRLLAHNVFPEPEGSYIWDWPALDEKTEQDEANLVQTLSNAINTGSGGNPFLVVSPEEYREKILGWKPERGAEVDTDDATALDPATAEDLGLDGDVEIDPGAVLDENDATNERDEREERGGRANQRYSEEQKVRAPDGRGLIVDVLTASFETDDGAVHASEESPTYVVVTESEDNPFGYYNAEELEREDWDAGIEEPVDDLRASEGTDRENALRLRLERALAAFRGNVAGDGHFEWPEPWRQSEKPARLIALDAWVSMGGSVSACMREMRGEVADPGRFCADFADRLYQWEYWRGDSWAPGS